MEEDGGSSGDAQFVAGKEGSPNCKSMQEVVSTICKKVEVTNYFLI